MHLTKSMVQNQTFEGITVQESKPTTVFREKCFWFLDPFFRGLLVLLSLPLMLIVAIVLILRGCYLRARKYLSLGKLWDGYWSFFIGSFLRTLASWSDAEDPKNGEQHA